MPCPAAGCSPGIDSKLEATFYDVNKKDFYDASAVDGWTLPYEMEFHCSVGDNSGEKLTTVDCKQLNEDACPTQTVGPAGNTSLKLVNP